MKTEATFTIEDILPIALVLVVTGIGVAYGLSIMADTKDDFYTQGTACGTNLTGGTANTIVYSNCSADYTAMQDSIEGTAKLPEKMPLIVNVIVAAIIIGLLIRYLMVRM
jgi:hypothetical protein